MKKLVLAVAVCYAFSVHGITVNSDAKLTTIEVAQGKINAFKAERENIDHKYRAIQAERHVALEKIATLEAEIKNLNCNHGVCTVPHFKARIEKIEIISKY